MSTKQITPKQFLAGVAGHQMKVNLDNGIYRHLSFRQQANSLNLWFEIVTWPGVLTIHGDMGTWTFSRVQDMFTFFRDDKLRINESYWAEKLQSGTHGGRDGAKVFSEDLFREQLLERLDNYDLSAEDLAEVTQNLKYDVLSRDNKYDLMIAARDFSCMLPGRQDDNRKRFHFNLCEMPDGKAYAYHFIWCLHAIVWGIQQYDAARVTNEKVVIEAN